MADLPETIKVPKSAGNVPDGADVERTLAGPEDLPVTRGELKRVLEAAGAAGEAALTELEAIISEAEKVDREARRGLREAR